MDFLDMNERKNKKQQPDLSRMGKLLLSGATMLGEACPDCKIPLFSQNGQIFCPQCNRKAVYAKDEAEIRQIEQNFSLEESTSQLKDILTGKLNFLANELASTNDPELINQLLELIGKILKIMKEIV